MELIYSGPTFRFGIIGFVLLCCGFLFGFTVSPLVFIAIVPGVSLLLSWKRIEFNTNSRNVEVKNYILIFPKAEFWAIDKMADIFVDYIWESESNEIADHGSTPSNSFSSSFELNLRDHQNNKLLINDYTDYHTARKEAERLAQIFELQLVDKYAEIQQKVVQRRKKRGKR